MVPVTSNVAVPPEMVTFAENVPVWSVIEASPLKSVWLPYSSTANIVTLNGVPAV